MSAEPPHVPPAILVCFALKEEAGPFRKLAANRTDIDVLITGIGRQNSRRAVEQHFSTHTPELVLTCGFAGGLDPALSLFDIVCETGDAALLRQLKATGAKSVKILCHDRIATTVTEKQKLRADTGADAVEMESAEIQAVCCEHRIPCATVRVISDTANEDLPLDFNQLSKPDMSLDFGKLALAIAKSPGKVGALLKLQKQTARAAKRLAETLAAVIG